MLSVTIMIKHQQIAELKHQIKLGLEQKRNEVVVDSVRIYDNYLATVNSNWHYTNELDTIVSTALWRYADTTFIVYKGVGEELEFRYFNSSWTGKDFILTRQVNLYWLENEFKSLTWIHEK